MLSSFLYVLGGAVIGATAYPPTTHYSPRDADGGDCKTLDGCRTHGEGALVPDPATFFNPHHDYKQDRYWDMCKGGSHCSPKDGAGRLYFDFKDESLVVEFLAIEGSTYDDVEVFVQLNGPPNTDSNKYNIHDGKCTRSDDCSTVKCHIPYDSLTGGDWYKDMCPNEDQGSWVFYLQITAVIVTDGHKVELYSRGVKEDVCWFSLSYCCTKCPDCKEKCHDDCYDYKPRMERACENGSVIVYGSGEHSHPLTDLATHHGHHTCEGKDGYFHRYRYEDLEVSVSGSLSVGDNTFASFVAEIDKENDDTSILVSVSIENPDYYLAEIGIFVECAGGIDDLHSQSDICLPETYPYYYNNEESRETYKVTIADEFQCHGDYLFAIFVKVCVTEGGDDCHYCEGTQ